MSCFDFVFSHSIGPLGILAAAGWADIWLGRRSQVLQRLTLARIKNLTLEASSFSAYEALEVGLIDQIIPADLSRTLVVQKLKQVLSGSVETFQAIKRLDAGKRDGCF